MKTALRHIVSYLVLLASVMAVSCKNQKTDHTIHTEKEQEVYTCPMHPQIIRNAPGSCPICGMDLVKKESGSEAVAGVQLEGLLKPANAFVVSTVPLTVMEQREEDFELNVVGTVAYDTRQAGAISSRVGGRIERLYVRYQYQAIKKGDRIMDIYSPELLTAQHNLLFVAKNDPANTSLLNAAKEKLLLLGMTTGQVSGILRSGKPQYSTTVYSNYTGFVMELGKLAPGNPPAERMPTTTNQELNVKEGMYLQAGQTIFAVYNPGRAWILLDIFPEQQPLVKVGNAVRIIPETAPSNNFRAKIDYIEPVLRPGSKTVSARVYFNNTDMRLLIGSRVTAVIFTKPQSNWWLPKEAVLSLGRDKIVFKKEDGGFSAQKIITGFEVNQFIHVISGLQQRDSVAVNAQYLVDNEAFIKLTE